jgi:hypothetical protein
MISFSSVNLYEKVANASKIFNKHMIIFLKITFLEKRYAKSLNDNNFWHTFFLKR